MVQYTLKNGTILEIHDKIVMNPSVFSQLCDSLNQNSIPTILDISFYFRHDFMKCSKLLHMALSKTTRKNTSTIELFSYEHITLKLLALCLQHKQDYKHLMDFLQDFNDKRVNLLKGYACLYQKEYSDAEFLFNSIRYQKGLDIVNLYKKNNGNSNDPIIQCYFSSSNWKITEIQTNNIDFLFRIGQSNTYDNEDNIDVKLTQIDHNILNFTSSNDFNGLIKSLNELTTLSIDIPDSAEILYMMGKVNHLLNNHSQAINEYKKSLLIDPNYEPARFNLCRILSEPFKSNLKNDCIYDYNALIGMKNNLLDINLEYCSDLIRKIGHCIIQMKLKNKKIIPVLESIKEYFEEDIIVNNIAIILKDKNMLEDLLYKCSPHIKEYVHYNLAVMKEDVHMLENNNIPEAKIQCDYFNKNMNTNDENLKIYFTKSKEILKNNKNNLSQLLYGCECINENDLHNAEKVFCEINNSMYSVNGLGIVYCLKGQYSMAIKLFKQIVDEFDHGYLNLGNAYFLNKEYRLSTDSYIRAIKGFMKREGVESIKSDVLKVIGISKNILKFLCKTGKDIKYLEEFINMGIKEFKGLKAILMLEMGEIEAVKQMNLDDFEVIKQLDACAEKESIRKRKMAEIEEYRKRRK